MSENLAPQTEWQQAKEAVKRIVLEIFDELDRIHPKNNDAWVGEWEKIRQKIIRRLTKAHVNQAQLQRCVAYHEILLSTTNRKRSPIADFSEELSILKQLEAARDKLSKIVTKPSPPEQRSSPSQS